MAQAPGTTMANAPPAATTAANATAATVALTGQVVCPQQAATLHDFLKGSEILGLGNLVSFGTQDKNLCPVE